MRKTTLIQINTQLLFKSEKGLRDSSLRANRLLLFLRSNKRSARRLENLWGGGGGLA